MTNHPTPQPRRLPRSLSSPSPTSAAGSALDRRRFLQALGALGLSGPLLAACGGSGGSDFSNGSGEAASSFRMSNWPFYMDEETLPAFKAATGIDVTYNEDLIDNEEYFAKIREPLSRNQDIGADLIVPTSWMVQRLMGLEWLAELDHGNLPNLANIEPTLADPAFDPGRAYSMPFVSGFTSLAYNRDLTGRTLTSLAEFFNPEWAGQVNFFSDMRDGVGLVLKSMGRSLQSVTTADVEAAVEKIAKAKADGQIRRFTGNDYGDDLVAGNVAVCMAYSGDVAQLKLDNPALEFVFPPEGMTQFVDTMVIPITAGAGAKTAAETFMNHLYDPVVNARLIASIQYISPVVGVGEELEKLDPTLAENVLINPPSEIRELAEDWRPLTDEEDIEFSSLYNTVVSS